MKSCLTCRSKILIAGAKGMVGSALERAARQKGYDNLLTPSHQELDYIDQKAVRCYLREQKPDAIIIAAAKVGGILANATYPADFLYQNLLIAANLIHEAHIADINRLLFLGSSCIYPRDAAQPIKEEALLTAPLEKTNEAYALAKICGVKLCEFYQTQYGRDYISAMPTNLYGPGDNYHPENSHVIPGLLRRFHEAKISAQPQVAVWGSGAAYREFLYVDDLAEGLLFLLESYHEKGPINLGSTEELTIAELANLIAEVVEYKGEIVQDLTKPDGTPRKKCDISRASQLGWRAKVGLKEGLKRVYHEFTGT